MTGGGYSLPDYGPPSSGISFTKEQLAARSNEIAPSVDRIDGLEQGTGTLNVPFPHFGVIGWSIQGLHGDAITEQREALARARRALESWMPALEAADKNYQKADEDSDTDLEDMGGLGGAGDLGGLGDPGGLDPDLPTGPEVPGLDDLPETPDGTLPDTDLPDTDLPDTDIPGAGDLPNSDLPNGDLPGAGDLPNTDPADMKVPDIDSALNDPAKTDLSAYQPNTPQVPNNLGSLDPSATGTRTGPGGTLGGTGLGTGGVQNAGLNGLGGGARGLNGSGMPMMPFSPMGGAGGAGNQERDREKTVGLSEDEGVWGGDEDIAPQVIGQEDV